MYNLTSELFFVNISYIAYLMEKREYFPRDYGGGLASMGMMQDGLRIGAWSYFNTDGTTRRTMNYDTNGKLHGIMQAWYSVEEGGGPKNMSHWDHGVVDGLCEMYDPLSCGGGLIFSATYRMGTLHGPLVYFAGHDTIVENYDNGRPMTRIHHRTPVAPTRNHHDIYQTSVQIDHICEAIINDDDSDDSDSSDDDADAAGALIATVSSDNIRSTILPGVTDYPSPRESSPRESSPRESSPRESSPRDSASRESTPRQSSLHNRNSFVERMEPAQLEHMQLLNQRVARLRLPD